MTTFDSYLVEVLSAIGAVVVGFAVFHLSRRKHSGGRDTTGVLMTYPDGRFSRKLSTGEVLLFLGLVFGLGGLCVWGLLTYIEKA